VSCRRKTVDLIEVVANPKIISQGKQIHVKVIFIYAYQLSLPKFFACPKKLWMLVGRSPSPRILPMPLSNLYIQGGAKKRGQPTSLQIL